MYELCLLRCPFSKLYNVPKDYQTVVKLTRLTNVPNWLFLQFLFCGYYFHQYNVMKDLDWARQKCTMEWFPQNITFESSREIQILLQWSQTISFRYDCSFILYVPLADNWDILWSKNGTVYLFVIFIYVILLQWQCTFHEELNTVVSVKIL